MQFTTLCNMWGGIAIDNLESALESWQKNYEEIYTILTTSPTEFKDGTIWAVMQNVTTIIQGAGASLLVIFFFLGFAKLGFDYRDLYKNPKHLALTFMRFGIAELFVVNATSVLLWLLSLFQELIVLIHLEPSLTYELPDDLRTALETASWDAGLGATFASLIGAVLIFILSMILLVIVYGRFFKIYILAAISPLPLAGFAGEATQPLATNFLKTFASECARGVLIILAMLIFSAFVSAPTNLDVSKPGGATWVYVFEVATQMLLLVVTTKASDVLAQKIFGI